MTDSFTGTRLGNYDVIELLGKGGMANVYRGYDPVLDRDVAIKVISSVGQSSDFVTRFKREARLVANLRHPTIVQIYHFGEQRDCVYMVQELLPGPTLEQRMRDARHRLAPAEIYAVVEQVAQALDFAHSRDVIHRDVKPSNILRNDHGQWVLTDFGIASNNAEAAHTTTQCGIEMGTPSYVAPELVMNSAAITTRCDIYALGVVLFELLTGRLPFEADTAMGIVLKHLYDAPPYPSSLRPDLPIALNDVVLRALNKEPEKRYACAIELVQALQVAWPAVRADAVSLGPIAPTSIRTASSMVTSASVPSHSQRVPVFDGRVHNVQVPAQAVQQLPVTQRKQSSVQHTPTSRTAPKPTSKSVSTTGPAHSTTAKAGRRAASSPTRPSVWRRIAVGVLTATLVSALILYGLNPLVFSDAWTTIYSTFWTWVG